jgi:hypothetical protein
MSNQLDALTRLLMIAESMTRETCVECGLGEDDAAVLREVHAGLSGRVSRLETGLWDAIESMEAVQRRHIPVRDSEGHRAVVEARHRAQSVVSTTMV